MLDEALLLSRAVFAAAGFGASFHLARSAIREGSLPTHAWGSGMIFVGGLGLVGYAAAPLAAGLDPRLAIAGLAVSDALERVALVGLGFFLWKVFGPHSAPRRVGAVAVAIALCVDWVAVLWLQSWPDTTLPLPLAATTHATFAMPLVWSAIESGLQARRSQRQLALGLTGPVVTNRFWLWMLGSAGLAAICLVTALEYALDLGGGSRLGLTALRIALHLGTAAVVVLGFFPPRIYVGYLARRAS